MCFSFGPNLAQFYLIFSEYSHIVGLVSFGRLAEEIGYEISVVVEYSHIYLLESPLAELNFSYVQTLNTWNT